ncbi:MAG: hypothetical protein BWZ10_00775 [candidate division BRC1 bacterium ADurb.BinA364]|nr:MAG: hypothetical protein BWZ10_00775 [candidate division BRC1 bacterium ADurb.BinA364]
MWVSFHGACRQADHLHIFVLHLDAIGKDEPSLGQFLDNRGAFFLVAGETALDHFGCFQVAAVNRQKKNQIAMLFIQAVIGGLKRMPQLEARIEKFHQALVARFRRIVCVAGFGIVEVPKAMNRFDRFQGQRFENAFEFHSLALLEARAAS